MLSIPSSAVLEPEDTAAVKPAAAPYQPNPVIGASLSRIDGPHKTTGRATYAADYSFPHMVYGVALGSTIANGTVRSIDTSAAEKMPGVLLVLTHENMGQAPAGRSGISENCRWRFSTSTT